MPHGPSCPVDGRPRAGTRGRARRPARRARVGMTARAATRPVGTVTRGTTNPNRLRRMDRWIAAAHGAELRRAADPLAVDLGYGAAPWTAVELLRPAAPGAPRRPGRGRRDRPRPGRGRAAVRARRA